MKLSLLVPVYDDQDEVVPFYERALPALEALPGLDSWELLFLNDGSTDATLERILSLRARDPRVKALTLSRNFGYHANIFAGLSHAEADLYAVIHVDCEDPPELLADFLREIRSGSQVAYGIRSQRDEAAPLTWLRGLFYHVNSWVSDSPTILWMAEFVMFTRAVREGVLEPKTPFPFLRTEIAHVGLKAAGVPYARARRRRGRSHYNLYTLTVFAIGGFLASSTFPLRMVLYLAAALGFGVPALALVLRLSLRDTAYLSMVLLFYFCLVSLSMLALYLARTYKNGVGRPLFVVDPGRTHLD